MRTDQCQREGRVPHKRNKLPTEEPVLRIIKVNRAVRKASSGSGFGGGGGG